MPKHKKLYGFFFSGTPPSPLVALTILPLRADAAGGPVEEAIWLSEMRLKEARGTRRRTCPRLSLVAQMN
ncbi:MAG: hypothetical protein LLG04_13410 [Parachlamydia sp.]|nr:hypothetical protein [Parachlamydia sp.]